jgi:hypothetical protein
MKHFMITYQFKSGTRDAWHKEIGRFIAAINDDPELKGRLSYRCMKHRDDDNYVHLASVVDDQTQSTLQSRDVFKAYTEMTRKIAGGEVTVTPIELIAATAA